MTSQTSPKSKGAVIRRGGSPRTRRRAPPADPGDEFRLGNVTLDPNGGQVPWHNQEQEEVYFIIEGTGEMCLGEERQTLTTGQMVYIPSGVFHQLTNIGADAAADDLLLRARRRRGALAAGTRRHAAQGRRRSAAAARGRASAMHREAVDELTHPTPNHELTT